jgi:methyl-accepting chemotaxis protein
MSGKFAGLPTRTKLAALLLSLLIPVAMLLFMDLHASWSKVSEARREDQGVDWARALMDVARNTGEHRDHALKVGAGHEEERAEMLEHGGLVEESSKTLDELLQKDSHGFDKAVGWDSLGAAVRKAIGTDPASPELFDAHSKAFDQSLAAIGALTDIAGLTNDPDADSFALIDAAMLQMPAGLDALALARRHFDSIIAGDGSTKMHADLAEQLGIANGLLENAFGDLLDAYARAAPEEKAIPAAAAAVSATFHELYPQLVAVGAGATLTADVAADLSRRTEELTESLAALQDQATDRLEFILDRRVSNNVWSMVIHLVIVLAALAVAVVVAMMVMGHLTSKVKLATEVFSSMEQGRFDSHIEEQPSDELGTLLRSLDRMQVGLREKIESERRVATINSRIKQSLDATSSNVMVADENNNIIYTNKAVDVLMRNSQPEIRRQLPDFDALRLLGANIDVFHRNASHQRNMLAQLDKAQISQIRIGGLTFRIVLSPIADEQGRRIGTVVEWVDRTQEVAIENEVQTLVAEALKGNLGNRLVEEGKTGFLKVLSGGLNELVANVETVVAEVQTLVKAVNDGNLTSRIETQGKSGLMVKLGSGINDLTANIATVVEQVQTLVSAANSGDLNARIALEGQSGLLVKVGAGINELTEGMATIVSQVKVAASEVSRGADEISLGNANLSQRTEEQASSLEETASSMEQMTSTVKQNAENAGQANQLALAARDQAEKGGSVVQKAVKAMTDINVASGKIANIIGVIDEIAFQTNLLALNAAVEAARAGEQGRGFAVVASEVRSLAGRSATAAKEIKTLIQDSVHKVEEGSNLVTQSGDTLEQIVGAVKKVTDIVAEIAAASQEQSAGIDQVNKAVMQLDELTQQNAALVEQASAASQSMAEQARGLNESMSRYKVGDGQLADTILQQKPRPATRPVQPARSAPQKARAVAAAAPRARAAAATGAAAGATDAAWKEF